MPRRRLNERGLSAQEEAFCIALVADPERNAQRSYEEHYRARGNAAKTSASRLLTNANVAAYIAELEAIQREQASSKFGIDNAWLTERYRRISEFDVRKLFDAEGNLKSILDLDDDTAYVVAAIDISMTKLRGKDQDEIADEVTKKFRAWDKLKALEALGRHIGYFNEDKSQAPRIILSGFARPKRVDKGA